MNMLARPVFQITINTWSRSGLHFRSPSTQPIYICVLCIRKTSERVGRTFRKYNVHFLNMTTFWNPRPVYKRAGLVYKVDCDAVYVGETGDRSRIVCVSINVILSLKKSVAKVYNHGSNTGQGFDFNNVKVLDNCSHYKFCLQLVSKKHSSVTNNIYQYSASD